MTGLLIALAGIALLALAAWLARRARVKAGLVIEVDAFPETWDRLLRQDFAVYARLPASLRDRLKERIVDFVTEKQFEACGNFREITEEMRVFIAAQACLLLVGRPQDRLFPRLHSILVYPQAFRDRGRRVFGLEDGDDVEREIRLGESWQTGSVILSWQSVRSGAASEDDGVNVVFHEFAHQLDQADGASDGTPTLDAAGEYQDWEKIMRREFDALVDQANDPHADPLLDPYGAENPAEFFAVATETFFEMPEDLQTEHPELYRELSDYYGVDPATWFTR